MDTMRYRELGQTGLTVSTIGFGAWAIGGNQWGPTDDRDSIDAIRCALDLGVTFFDTADAYGFGHSEEVCARALSDSRDRVILATKGGLRWDDQGRVWRDSSSAYITRAVEASLKRLNVDTIDLYQIHWPDPKTPQEETMNALGRLVEQGKIRYIGVSNYTVEQLDAACRVRPVDTLQPVYHLFDWSADEALLPYCHEHQIGVVVYGPMAHGMLAGRINEDTVFPENDWRSTSRLFTGEGLRRNAQVVREFAAIARELGRTPNQLAAAWTLMNPATHVAIVGAKSARQVQANVESDFTVPGDAMGRIRTLFEQHQWKEVPFPEP